MKEKNWSYLAGIFDGEGYIGISINHRGPRNGRDAAVEYQARIVIVNTSLKLMKWLITNFGGVYYSRQKTEGWRLSYNWEPKGAHNKELLLLGILPYLQIKKEQANLLLQFLRMENKSDKEARQKLYEQSKILNRTGDSVTTETPSGTPTEDTV